MTAMTMSAALARVTGELVDSNDVTATLQLLVLGCADALDDSPTGVLALGADGRLELMAASSHVAAELELYHSQVDEGPALDAIRSGVLLQAVDSRAIAAAWPSMVEVIASAGVRSIIAAPMRWHGRNFGALNVFRLTEGSLTAESISAIQGLADLAALSIAYSHVSPQETELTDALQRALDGRTVIEQAKGVIAAQDGVSLAVAFRGLIGAAEEDGISLPGVSTRVVARGSSGAPWRR